MTITFEIERETKNTIRYSECPNPDGQPPVIGTIYIQKWTFGKDTPPATLTITLDFDPKA